MEVFVFLKILIDKIISQEYENLEGIIKKENVINSLINVLPNFINDKILSVLIDIIICIINYINGKDNIVGIGKMLIDFINEIENFKKENKKEE